MASQLRKDHLFEVEAASWILTTLSPPKDDARFDGLRRIAERTFHAADTTAASDNAAASLATSVSLTASASSTHDDAASLASVLQDGMIISLLWQKISAASPRDVTFAALKPPKSGAFAGRDSVAVFLRGLKAPPFQLNSAFLFDSDDLANGKNVRNVVTCILQVAHDCARLGKVEPPEIIKAQVELEEQERLMGHLDDAAMDAQVQAGLLREAAGAVLPFDVVRVTAPAPSNVDAPHDVSNAGVAPDESKSASDANRPSTPDANIAPVLAAPEAAADHVASEEARIPAAVVPTVADAIPTAAAAQHVEPQVAPKAIAAAAPPTPPAPAAPTTLYHHINAIVARKLQRIGSSAKTCILPMGSQDQFAIVHRITGKKSRISVRNVRNVLMVRVGGGWEEFEAFIDRRLVDLQYVGN